MGYIRTKDGIYKYADYLGIHNGKRYALMDDKKGKRITMRQEPNELYKSADTIEELMMIGDLVFKKNGDIFVIQNQAYIDYYIAHKSVSKLFIKVDNGFRLVAKMNDKGELELL